MDLRKQTELGYGSVYSFTEAQSIYTVLRLFFGHNKNITSTCSYIYKISTIYYQNLIKINSSPFTIPNKTTYS